MMYKYKDVEVIVRVPCCSSSLCLSNKEVKDLKQKLTIILLLYVVASFLLIPSVQASPQTGSPSKDAILEDMVDSQLESLNMDELKGFWESIMDEYGGFLPESQKGSLYDFIKG